MIEVFIVPLELNDVICKILFSISIFISIKSNKIILFLFKCNNLKEKINVL